MVRLSQLTSATGLTANAAAARAAAVDPAVRKRTAIIAERDAAVRTSDLANVPQLTATLGYTRLSELDAVELAPGVSVPQVLDTFTTKLELSIPLTDYFLRFPALTEAAELRKKAARVDARSAELQAESRARTAYWQWVRASLRVIVSEQSLTQVRATVAQMQARVDAQRASRADLLRIKAQEADARRALFSAQERAGTSERQLRQVIGARPDEVLAIGEDVFAVPALPDLGVGIEALTTQAASQRSEIAAIDLAVDALAASRRATDAGLYPRVDAFASVNYDNPNSRVLLGGSEWDATWAAGLRLTWKLNDVLAVDPQSDAIGAQIQQLRADRDTLTRQLELTIADVVQNVNIALESRRTTADAKAAAEESYRIRAELLANDRATAVELVDAETELTRVRIQEIDALIDLRIALSDLTYTLGDPR